jgi:hypothetical protein
MALSFSALPQSVIVLPEPQPPQNSSAASGVSSSKNCSCAVPGIGPQRMPVISVTNSRQP